MAAGLDAGKGATLRARVLGYNWERQGQRSIMECGLFVLDDVSFRTRRRPCRWAA